jgi:hypothetical protein
MSAKNNAELLMHIKNLGLNEIKIKTWTRFRWGSIVPVFDYLIKNKSAFIAHS